MVQADKDRVGEVIQELATVESMMRHNWLRSVKGIITELEKHSKNKTTSKEVAAAITTKRIPAAKALLKALEGAGPALGGAIDIKWDKYASGEDYMKEVGATAVAMAEEALAKLATFNHSMELGSGMVFLSFHPFMKELFVTSKTVKTAFVQAKQKLGELHKAPARPAAQAPPRPAAAAAPARPAAASPVGKP